MPLSMRAITAQTDHMELFEQLCDIIADFNVRWLSEESGVSEAAIYFWLDGSTKKPRLDTIFKVAQAVGWNITLVKTKAVKGRRSHLRVVK